MPNMGEIKMNNNENNNLVEIGDVAVDKALPKPERILEFVRQIRNPYLFRCGSIDIEAEFDPNGPPLEECLGLLAT